MVTHKIGDGMVNEYYGKSTDEKPTGCPNASTFYEFDTTEVYMYDKDTDEWIKQ